MALQKPKIMYKTVAINKNNVDSVLASRHGGYFSAKTNVIVLFKYTIAANLPESKKKDVLFFINIVKEYNDKIIFHEMQHWQNHNSLSFCFDNYYQDNFSDCMDEVSALTAEFIYTDTKYKSCGVYQALVARSMMNASFIFLHYKFDRYMDRFINSALQYYKKGDSGVTIAQLQNWQNMYKNNSPALLGENFYNATKNFFTYNGYCIFDDKIYEYVKGVWNDANESIKQIKQKCMDRTYQMIDTIIKESR